jgi:hypothetical protein
MRSQAGKADGVDLSITPPQLNPFAKAQREAQPEKQTKLI